jgi:murein L,D-transpeptidase YafK
MTQIASRSGSGAARPSRRRWTACAHLVLLCWALPAASAVAAEAPRQTAAPQEAREALQPVQSGSPLLIRIFKEESEVELWTQVGDRFRLAATYPVCFWSGTLGPKLYEGDRQAPEGFYTIGPRQLVLSGRHPRAIDIGFPNAFDRSLARTGSHILLHGGCRSIGCFAMTDGVMERIYAFAEAALRGGQAEIPVHIFPFRMTEANLQRHAASPWLAFWQNLKQVHDAFEATHTVPIVDACRGAYRIRREADVPENEAPEDCTVPPAAFAVARKAQELARRAQLPRHVPARVLTAARPAARPARARSAPVALPRDNVAECDRLWSRATGVSQAQWKAICRRLDFQQERRARTATRTP